jgi:hypothetical protein
VAANSAAISACELQRQWQQALSLLAVTLKAALVVDVIALSCHQGLRVAATMATGIKPFDVEGCFALDAIALSCHQCRRRAAAMPAGFEPFGSEAEVALALNVKLRDAFQVKSTGRPG